MSSAGRPKETVTTACQALRGLARTCCLAPAAEQVEASEPERDEQDAEQVADAAALSCGRDDQRHAESDEDAGEHGDEIAIELQAACAPAPTITRHVALRSTKSTVLPKIALRPLRCGRRGAPMTMISE